MTRDLSHIGERPGERARERARARARERERAREGASATELSCARQSGSQLPLYSRIRVLYSRRPSLTPLTLRPSCFLPPYHGSSAQADRMDMSEPSRRHRPPGMQNPGRRAQKVNLAVCHPLAIRLSSRSPSVSLSCERQKRRRSSKVNPASFPRLRGKRFGSKHGNSSNPSQSRPPAHTRRCSLEVLLRCELLQNREALLDPLQEVLFHRAANHLRETLGLARDIVG